jgi:hypothetical protein
MSAAERTPVSIAKEAIINLRFPIGEVLKNKDDISRRRKSLDRAMILGNVEKSKVRIIFEDEAHMQMVETTIWGVTEERVILKGGVVIPMQRIHEVIA